MYAKFENKNLLLQFFSTFLILFLLTFKTSSCFARAAPESFSFLAEELSPAVVNISTTQIIREPQRAVPIPEFPPGSAFEEIFKELFRSLPQSGEPSFRRAQSLGSGFIIDPKGLVVTNYHVIEASEEIIVSLSSGFQYEAYVIGFDVDTDIALLQLIVPKKDTKSGLPFVQFGNSDKAKVGDWVLAIGNPYGLGGTITAGIISARNRDIQMGQYDDFIQTDAAINRGNSGGPLFNMDGEVIGVNTAIYSITGESVGIAFAIPSAIAGNIVTQLEEFGEVRRGWLGVEIHPVTEEIAMSIGLKNPRGALVASTVDSSPAAKAGIVSGDVILVFGGKDIESFRDLPRVVADTKPGSEVSVKIWRGNKVQEFNVFLGTKGQLSKGVTDSPSEGE